MQLIAFPAYLDSIQQKIALASISPSRWSSVLSTLEDIFENSIASIDKICMSHGDCVYFPQLGPGPGEESEQTSPPLLISSSAHPRGSTFHLDEWPLALDAAAKLRCRQSEGASELQGVGVVLDWCGPWAWVLSIRAAAASKSIPVQAIAAQMRRIAGEMCQAFAVSHGFLKEPYDSAALETIWDRLQTGVAMFGGGLRIIAANMAAEDALTSRRYFAPDVRGARLRAISSVDNDRLWSAAERVLSGESNHEFLSLDGLRERQPLPIALRSIPDRWPAERERGRSDQRSERLLALIGSWNVEDAVKSQATA